jgi:uridine kinase
MNDNQAQTVHCINTGKSYRITPGETLKSLSERECSNVTDPKSGRSYPVLAALVDHKLKELSYNMIYNHEIEFIGYNHPDGRRTYIRSLCFLAQYAVRELFPDLIFVVDHSLPTGLYCKMAEARLDEDGRIIAHPLSQEDINAIRSLMRELVAKDLPFTKKKIPTSDAIELFTANKQYAKANLQRSLGKFFCNTYYLNGQADSFHGPLVYSTGELKTFDLYPFKDGFCLLIPASSNPDKVTGIIPQEKLSATLDEYSDWCQITGILGVGTLNESLLNGDATQLINIAEALQERKFTEIANMIYENRKRIKIIFIAGPSSSGKTSSSLRLAIQCRVLGLNPKVIELDNYFVDREHTPKDEDGDFDFEALEAMDLPLLNDHLNRLLAGEEVEIPRYDFKAGKPRYEGNMLHLNENDILIMEGIHALDPAMVPGVDNSRIFRIYASALTSLNLDENNCLSTSDNRLLRRIVRDNRTRGISPEQTILRWQSVRKGENKYIFPFQENCDAMLNTALIYELPLLKYYAEPLLRRILPTSPAYGESIRLIKFLACIVALHPEEISAIPPTSIMREFIGGQTL